MDPDTSPSPADEPPVFNYILSFLLVGVAWGFTTPFIRRAAADFNARQELHQQSHDESSSSPSNPQDPDATEERELQSRRQRRHRDEAHSEQETAPLREGGGSESDSDEDEDHPPPEARPAWMNQNQNQGRSQTSSSVKTNGKSSWLKTKIIGVFWTVVNLLRTPAYAIPLIVNLTGSVWFFLLVGKHELSLTVPLANSSAFLFTVLGEWYVERKVIEKETWLGMALVLGGIAICVKSKGS
ncbi:uncharacterized protein KD926_009492 [Aspergillus affinis]|uniref:uncharacterized protein n=1 Tax=Aspergillus affinis TaxID=1070780 RepID=UPI0022FDD1D8|nr:uncharacterized protein KD926_009492 [Aspergillus affinis]KAI9039349.1 hypothetical protein KD926_009492 [Aspergillus affinis]